MIQVQLHPPANLKGRELLDQEIDPEIRAFEAWFQDAKRGAGRLIPLEKEILRAFLHWKLTSSG